MSFIDVATTVQQVSASPGNPIPILMPSDVLAGDYLVAFTLNPRVNVTSPTLIPSGWVLQNTDVFYKVADGSEAGATLNWTTRDTTTAFGSSRAHTAIVLCYRFSEPVAAISHSPRGSFGGFGPDLAIDYGGSSSGYGFWVTCCVAYTTSGGDLFPLAGYDWLNVEDRSGKIDNVSSIELPFDVQDASSATAGDTNIANPTAHDPGIGIVLHGNPDGFGSLLSNIKFLFNAPLEVPNYWGILVTTT